MFFFIITFESLHIVWKVINICCKRPVAAEIQKQRLINNRQSDQKEIIAVKETKVTLNHAVSAVAEELGFCTFSYVLEFWLRKIGHGLSAFPVNEVQCESEYF